MQDVLIDFQASQSSRELCGVYLQQFFPISIFPIRKGNSLKRASGENIFITFIIIGTKQTQHTAIWDDDIGQSNISASTCGFVGYPPRMKASTSAWRR